MFFLQGIAASPPSLNQLPANILALRTLLDSVLDSTFSLIYLISASF